MNPVDPANNFNEFEQGVDFQGRDLIEIVYPKFKI